MEPDLLMKVLAGCIGICILLIGALVGLFTHYVKEMGASVTKLSDVVASFKEYVAGTFVTKKELEHECGRCDKIYCRKDEINVDCLRG